jgi:hypothetical protein
VAPRDEATRCARGPSTAADAGRTPGFATVCAAAEASGACAARPDGAAEKRLCCCCPGRCPCCCDACIICDDCGCGCGWDAEVERRGACRCGRKVSKWEDAAPSPPAPAAGPPPAPKADAISKSISVPSPFRRHPSFLFSALAGRQVPAPPPPSSSVSNPFRVDGVQGVSRTAAAAAGDSRALRGRARPRGMNTLRVS